MSAENAISEQNKYKGDWNLNLKYLDYVAYLITRAGYMAENEFATEWLKQLEELYRITGGVVKKPEYKARLKDIKSRIKTPIGAAQNQATQLNMLSVREWALDKLDEWEIEYIGLLHEKNLILPKSDKKRGLEVLEGEYGIC